MTWPLHGANPQFLYKETGINQPDQILDFSVNTNPFGCPIQFHNKIELIKAVITQYPDPFATGVKECISIQEKVSRNQILIGNGGSECIFLLANYFRGKNICIVEPTFGEYRKACMAFNCNIESFVLKEVDDWQIKEEGLYEYITRNDAIFICHPNNPTGTIYPESSLLHIIEAAKRHNTICVIDEAFYDFCNQSISLRSYINDYPNLIILRSLTKMYSMPGVRLGYVLGNEKIIEQIKQFQPPWSINGIAQALGQIILNNQQFVQETKTKVAAARERLLLTLQESGYYVSNSKVNFFLLREKEKKTDSQELIRFLLESGIVPRHTYNFIGLNGEYIRLAVKTLEDNEKLVEALTRWKNRC